MSAEGQLEAARLEYVEGRRRKTDFALWRAEEPGKRRVLRWDSPWGWGAPGWHLECSVMSMALLGEHFDLHTGGVDHRELHHVNEIAQSQAYLGDGQPWVRYWLHNEFLQLGAMKMAKSAGGAPRLADLTEAGYHPLAYRLFLLGGHYRSQLDFTPAAMDAAQATLRRLVARVQPLRPLPVVETLAEATANVQDDPVAQRYLDTIDAAIAADLGTPKILAALQDALRDPAITPDGQRTVVAAADALLGLGLATLAPEDLERRRAVSDLSGEEQRAIAELVADRTQARKERDWARADQIRAQLDELGVQVTDTPEARSGSSADRHTVRLMIVDLYTRAPYRGIAIHDNVDRPPAESGRGLPRRPADPRRREVRHPAGHRPAGHRPAGHRPAAIDRARQVLGFNPAHSWRWLRKTMIVCIYPP